MDPMTSAGVKAARWSASPALLAVVAALRARHVASAFKTHDGVVMRASASSPPPGGPRHRRGTLRKCVRALWVTAVLGLSPLCVQGQPLPQWQLEADAEVEIGPQELPLHRVVGGALLEGGRIAIVDAGNFQVVIVSRTGDVLQRIGTRGDGPGEFVALARLDAFGDTLVMYDPALGRVTTALADGALLGTVRLPALRSSQTLQSVLRAVVTPEQYVLSATEPAEAPRSEPEVRFADVASYEPNDGTVTLFRRRPIAYTFGVTRSSGYTAYRASFLGETQFARWRAGYVSRPWKAQP